MDLPGIYSLSPYTLEEVVARNYLIDERPDAILNIIDGTNLERNLYLTTQLTELGIPVVIAINMIDVVRKNGDQINVTELSRELGCQIVEISALKGDGVMEAAEAAVQAAHDAKTVPMHTFSGPVEHAIAHIEEAAVHNMPEEQQRWYAIKIFERDDKVLSKLNIPAETLMPTSRRTSRPPRRSWTTTPRASSPTSATSTSPRSSRPATRRKRPVSSPPPIRSTRSSPTAGWACPSSRW